MEPLERAKNIGLTSDPYRSGPVVQSNGREIKEVWCYNLDSEMNEVMKAATKYPIIGMVGLSHEEGLELIARIQSSLASVSTQRTSRCTRSSTALSVRM